MIYSLKWFTSSSTCSCQKKKGKKEKEKLSITHWCTQYVYKKKVGKCTAFKSCSDGSIWVKIPCTTYRFKCEKGPKVFYNSSTQIWTDQLDCVPLIISRYTCKYYHDISGPVVTLFWTWAFVCIFSKLLNGLCKKKLYIKVSSISAVSHWGLNII